MQAMVAGLLTGVGRMVRYRDAASKRGERFIRQYVFPDAIAVGLRRRYPHLRDDGVAKVMHGLREYFSICNAAGRGFVSMPSQAVDVAWHELLLFTRTYGEFCKRALGGYLHHTPAAALPRRTLLEEGLRRAWRLSCQRENIDPKNAARLPFLFAIDSDLAILDGFFYSLNRSDAGIPRVARLSCPPEIFGPNAVRPPVTYSLVCDLDTYYGLRYVPDGSKENQIYRVAHLESWDGGGCGGCGGCGG